MTKLTEILILLGFLLVCFTITTIIVAISNIGDTSPTKLDWCRGGHDF